MVAALGFAGLLASSTSCASLADFTLGVCGNSVLETGEDCEPGDKNSDPDKPGYCAPKGDPSECHYVCRKTACPTGESCGVDQVCRAPAATFSAAGPPIAETARDLRVGDFDGDGRSDVLLSKDGAIDLYFSTGRTLAPPAALPASPSGGLAVGYLNLDIDPADASQAVKHERADIVVGSGAALAGLLGDPGRKLTVAAASSYTFSNPTRILAAPSHFIPEAAPGLKPDTEREGVMSQTDSGFSIVVKSTNGDQLKLLVGPGGDAFPAKVEDISNTVLLAPLVEGRTTRCDEILISVQSVDGAVFVAYPCDATDAPNDTGSPSAVKIGVPSGATVTGPAIVADLIKQIDGSAGTDGHLDVAIPISTASGFGLYVAPGDGTVAYPGVESGHVVHSVDYCSLGGEAAARCIPIENEGLLAAKDLNGDGQVDLITHLGVWLSSPTGYYDAASSLLKPWSEAVVADINHDGRPDVVAVPDGERKGLEVLLNSGASYFNPTILQTINPTGLLTVGDFDGDLISDVVARSATPGSSADCGIQDEIVAYFGRESGGLEDGRVVGRLAGVTQIVSGRLPRLDRRDSISDFGVASHCADDSNRISVYYGTGDRLLDAPFLLTDQFGDTVKPVVAPYAPKVIALPSGSLGAVASTDVTVATLATFAGSGSLLPEKAELFIQSSSPSALFNKKGHVVHIPDLTETLAEGAALAVANFDSDPSAEVAVWIPSDGGPASAPRLLVIDDYDCVPDVTNGAGTCPAQDATRTTIDLPASLTGESVQKVRFVVADLDGDKFDDFVLVVVGDAGHQLFFAHNNTPSRKPGDPLFTLTEVAGVSADSAAILPVALDGSGLPAVVFSGSSGILPGLYAVSFPKGVATAPMAIVGLDGSPACDAACDVSTSIGTGDVDGDGLDDVVFRRGDTVSVFYRDTKISGSVTTTKGGAK